MVRLRFKYVQIGDILYKGDKRQPESATVLADDLIISLCTYVRNSVRRGLIHLIYVVFRFL